MTDRLILSKKHQEEIAGMAAREAGTSRSKMKTALTWLGAITLGTIAGVALLPVLPAAVVGVIGAAVGIMAGGIAGSEYKNVRAMDRVQKETGNDDFVAKLQAKATRAANVKNTSNKVSNIGLWANVGLLLTGIIFPPAHIITEPIRMIAVSLWGGGALMNMVSRAEQRSFEKLNSEASYYAPQDTQVRSNENAVSSLKQVISPGIAFDKAANSNDIANDTAAPKVVAKSKLSL